MITSAGTGSSAWRDLDVTRWREDATRDCWGQFYYVRDLGDDRCWSIGTQPLVRAGDAPDVDLRIDRAEFRRRDGDVETRCAVCVVPDADAELRVVTLVNHGQRRRDLELTSYAEVCLNARRADQAHPAFAKLFLETEFDAQSGALLARRRPRGAKEHPVWAIHVSTSDVSDVSAAPVADEIAYETDRVRFLGRGRTPANPAAMDAGSRLSRTTGPVLDPIFSLRRRIALDAGMTARVAFMTGAADTREAAMGLAERFRDLDAIDAAFAGAHARCRTGAAGARAQRGRDRAIQPPGGVARVHERCSSRPRMQWLPTALDSEVSGRTRSPATCRSCWLESHRTMTRRSFANSSGGAATSCAGD